MARAATNARTTAKCFPTDGRLRWDFHQRLQEIARDFRQDWLAKMDDTTRSIGQALERARTQKQTSAQAAAVRTGELDQSLTEILKVEANFMALKEEIEASAD